MNTTTLVHPAPATRSLPVSVDGAVLAVTSRGDRNLPTVLLVHGYPDSSRVWEPVIEHLVNDFHVVTYDVRGAGASTSPANTRDYRLEVLADDLRRVIDAVSPGKAVHVLAHDWGSIQAWEAVTDPAMRSRIASYTTISGPCLDHAGLWLRKRLFSLSPRLWLEAGGQLLRSWYVFVFHFPLLAPLAWRLGLANAWPRLLRGVEGAKLARPSITQQSDGITGVRLYRANFLPRLFAPRQRPTEVPVQLLVPAQEHYVSPHVHDDLRDVVPRLWRRELAAGHWPQLAMPDVIARHTAEFVRHIEGEDAGGELARARVPHTDTPRAKLPFAGRLAVVTGAGSGIGRETLLDLAARGATTVAVDINAEAAERTAALARLLGGEAHAFRVDVGSHEDMSGFAATVLRDIGVPDIVVNNAGIGLSGAFLETTTDDWERVLRVNVWGVIHGSRLFGRAMVAAGKPGAIVNTASAAAFSPSRILSAYATSKAAVYMLDDCIRAEFASHGISVSTICPGFVDTGITTSARFVGVSDAEQSRLRDASKRLYQLRNLHPRAVSSAIVKAISNGTPVVCIGAESHGMRLLSRFSPALVRLLARVDLTP